MSDNDNLSIFKNTDNSCKIIILVKYTNVLEITKSCVIMIPCMS